MEKLEESKPIQINEQFLTPQQVSGWLQIKLSTVYKWTHVGYIPCIKLGGKVKGAVRFNREEVERWLKRKARRGRATYTLAEVGDSGLN